MSFNVVRCGLTAWAVGVGVVVPVGAAEAASSGTADVVVAESVGSSALISKRRATKVTVRARKSVVAGQPVTVSGRVTLGKKGLRKVRVKVQRLADVKSTKPAEKKAKKKTQGKKSRRWVTVTRARTDKKGRYRQSVTLPVVAKTRLRAVVKSSRRSAAAISKKRTIRVVAEANTPGVGNPGNNTPGTGTPGTGSPGTPTTPEPPLDQFVGDTLTAGDFHACALDSQGQAWCWGWNKDGQVGDGAVNQGDFVFSPVQVATDVTFTQITAGSRHTCGLDKQRRTWCWGSDLDGQVGDGATNQQDNVFSPVQVQGVQKFTDITAGGDHTCGIGTDRLSGKIRAWCWGEDVDGQVGDGSANQQDKVFAPVQVATDATFTGVTAGGDHTCGLDEQRRAWCWGEDVDGQVGDGAANQQDKVFVPVQVQGVQKFTDITAGGNHTCGIGTDPLSGKKRAWCWGRDDYGQVGNGAANQQDTVYAPAPVATNKGFTQITALGFHTCGLTPTGQAHCWGLDDYGQVGDGAVNQQDAVYAPALVLGEQAYNRVVGGYDYSCGVTTTDTIRCWGNAEYGQFGNGTGGPGNTFTPIAGPSLPN